MIFGEIQVLMNSKALNKDAAALIQSPAAGAVP